MLIRWQLAVCISSWTGLTSNTQRLCQPMKHQWHSMYGVNNALKRVPISNTGQPRWILSYLSWALWDHFKKLTFSIHWSPRQSPSLVLCTWPSHYSRWLPVHLRDMRNLHSAHPAVAEQFESGKFVVKKTHRSFSSIVLDHAHEQSTEVVQSGAKRKSKRMSNTRGTSFVLVT